MAVSDPFSFTSYGDPTYNNDNISGYNSYNTPTYNNDNSYNTPAYNNDYNNSGYNTPTYNNLDNSYNTPTHNNDNNVKKVSVVVVEEKTWRDEQVEDEVLSKKEPLAIDTSLKCDCSKSICYDCSLPVLSCALDNVPIF